MLPFSHFWTAPFGRGSERFISGSDAVETLQNIAGGIAQGDGAAVRAAHRTGRRGEGAQEPVDFGRLETRVDFDGGAAGDGGGDAAAQVVQASFAKLALRDFQDFE